jgi:hypothetical protein
LAGVQIQGFLLFMTADGNNVEEKEGELSRLRPRVFSGLIFGSMMTIAAKLESEMEKSNNKRNVVH